MTTRFNGKITTDIRDSTPDWGPYRAPQAKEGAPNVLMLVWDDLGYATMDIFGGPVETPNMKRLTDRGIKYSNFHTTALCSPSRSSLLNGRNATSNGMATVAEFSAGFPGISTRVPFENGFISEVLASEGYNTYCVGKWHLAPGEEANMAAYKGRWPLGRGFERFYGFLGGESSSWYPDLVYDNHQIDAPGTPDEGYHLSKDLSDKAIEFISDAHQVNPEKPFFMYLAPQAGHAPHHSPKEWIEKYKGCFDEGYEAIREKILKRQIELGLLPEGTELSPINPHGEPQRTGPDGQAWPLLDTVRPWESLTGDEKKLFARMAEVFAGYISYADHEIGRVLDYLEDSGQLDNTLVVMVSDNGASGEGGPNGSFNEWRFFNGVMDSTDDAMPHLDELGGPDSYNHYNTGWAWAFDTPFPYWKRWAGYEGGIADMCVISWPEKIKPQEKPRNQYIHAVDIAPTIYELIGVEPPESIGGYKQSEIEGESFAASISDATVPSKETQFYTMLGQRSLYHQGWLATALHPPLSGWGNFHDDVWELYDLENDRSQSKDLAAEHPAKLDELKSLWFYYAGIYNGLPLDDRTALEQVLSDRPSGAPERDRYTYYPRTADVSEQAAVRISGRSYTISSAIEVEADTEGVIFAHGGVSGGHSLYMKDGKLRYTFNWLGSNLQDVVSDGSVSPGKHLVVAEFTATGASEDPKMPGAKGTLDLYIDDQKVGSGEIVTQPGFFNLIGDGLCVGRDSASPVTPEYRSPFPFTGNIEKVIIDVSDERYPSHEGDVRAWFSID